MNLDYIRHATWELEGMKKARSYLSAFNTPEEDAELKAIKAELAERKAKARKAAKASR